MDAFRSIVRRDDHDHDEEDGMSPATVGLLFTLLALFLLGLVLVGALFFLRGLRQARTAGDIESHSELPPYEKRQSNHRRLTITTSPFGRGRESVVVYHEKQDLLSNSPTSPNSPVPEIRITFPDEVDESGKRQSGRVLVVRVGEHGVGLEPMQEDLPPYSRDTTEQFDSLDLDSIGGLKEKNDKDYS